MDNQRQKPHKSQNSPSKWTALGWTGMQEFGMIKVCVVIRTRHPPFSDCLASTVYPLHSHTSTSAARFHPFMLLHPLVHPHPPPPPIHSILLPCTLFACALRSTSVLFLSFSLFDSLDVLFLFASQTDSSSLTVSVTPTPSHRLALTLTVTDTQVASTFDEHPLRTPA